MWRHNCQQNCYCLQVAEFFGKPHLNLFSAAVVGGALKHTLCRGTHSFCDIITPLRALSGTLPLWEEEVAFFTAFGGVPDFVFWLLFICAVKIRLFMTVIWKYGKWQHGIAYTYWHFFTRPWQTPDLSTTVLTGGNVFSHFYIFTRELKKGEREEVVLSERWQMV